MFVIMWFVSQICVKYKQMIIISYLPDCLLSVHVYVAYYYRIHEQTGSKFSVTGRELTQCLLGIHSKLFHLLLKVNNPN